MTRKSSASSRCDNVGGYLYSWILRKNWMPKWVTTSPHWIRFEWLPNEWLRTITFHGWLKNNQLHTDWYEWMRVVTCKAEPADRLLTTDTRCPRRDYHWAIFVCVVVPWGRMKIARTLPLDTISVHFATRRRIAQWPVKCCVTARSWDRSSGQQVGRWPPPQLPLPSVVVAVVVAAGVRLVPSRRLASQSHPEVRYRTIASCELCGPTRSQVLHAESDHCVRRVRVAAATVARQRSIFLRSFRLRFVDLFSFALWLRSSFQLLPLTRLALRLAGVSVRLLIDNVLF